MARPLVVDASAALGVLLREPGSAEARERLASPTETHLLVPSHFWLEVTNVLVRRYGLTPDTVVGALRDLDDVGFQTVSLDRPGVLLTLDLMIRHGLTAYDAAYLALAEVEDARLLTLDHRLGVAAGRRGAIQPKRGTAETPEPYGALPPPTWAAHGRYLAELRRAATRA
jgi:predicted nucleic acid-binding protein